MYCHTHHCHYHHCNCVPKDSKETGRALTQEELLAYTQEMKEELKDYTVDLKDQIFSYIDIGLNPVEIANTFASLKEQDTYILRTLTNKIDELNNTTNLSMYNLRARVTGLESQSATLINELAELEVSAGTMRQDLANPDKGALMVRRAVIYADTISDLQAIDTRNVLQGQIANVKGSVIIWNGDHWSPIGAVTVEAFGATGDGVSFDDDAFFQAFEYSGHVVLREGGVYRLSSTTSPDRDFILQGSGAKIVFNMYNGDGAIFVNTGNVAKIENLVMENEHPSTPYELGIVSDGADVFVKSCSFIRTGISANSGVRMRIQDCLFDGKGQTRYGCAFWNISDFGISGNTIKDYNNDGIKISGVGELGGGDGYITNNYISNCLDDVLDIYSSGKYVTIQGNRFVGSKLNIKNWGTGNLEGPVWARNVTITGNTFESCWARLSCNSITFSGNSMYLNGSPRGIHAEIDSGDGLEKRGISITGNIIEGVSVHAAINVGSTHKDIIISSNVIKKCSHNGITLAATNAVVSNNTIVDCENRGIQLASAENVSVTGNIISQIEKPNLIYGIRVAASSSNVVITGNVVKNSDIPINDDKPGNSLISNNQGYKDRLFGEATIPDGESSIVIEVDLPSTPRHVLVTPKSSESVWISQSDPSTITITRDGTSGNLSVFWDVMI